MLEDATVLPTAALILLGDTGPVDPEIVEKALADTGAHDMAGAPSGQDQQRRNSTSLEEDAPMRADYMTACR